VTLDKRKETLRLLTECNIQESTNADYEEGNAMTISGERPVYLTTAEVAAWLGVPSATLGSWAFRGVGPRYIKIGGLRKYRPEDVEAWLARQPTGGEQVPA
jgi:excisionase family DNA binding protein